jgi:6-phosphogluconolactonase
LNLIGIVTFLLSLGGINSACMAQELESNTAGVQYAIVGTYTRTEGHVDGEASGIYVYRRDPKDGQLQFMSTVDGIVNPSYIAVSPDRDQIFAVSELGSEGEPTGLIYSYRTNQDMLLYEIMHTSTNGKYPCYVSTDSKGRYVFVANYVGGVDMFKNNDGYLVSSDRVNFEGSSDHKRQDASHPHMAKLSPDDRYLYVPDLGSNKIWIFEIDYIKGKLIANTFQPYVEFQQYAGPRHMTLNPLSGDAYVISELDNTVSVFAHNKIDGTLSLKQTISTLPVGYDGETYCADIHVHPNGRFVYGSNRGHNSIVVFSINETDGLLTLLEHTYTHGDFPRNFALDADGNHLYVANQNTHNIVQFLIDQSSGRIQYQSEIAVQSPVCIAFSR